MQILAGVRYPSGSESITYNLNWGDPPFHYSEEVLVSETLPDFQERIARGDLLPYTEHHVRKSGWTVRTKSPDHECAVFNMSGKLQYTYFGPSVYVVRDWMTPVVQFRDVSQTIARLQQRAEQDARKGAFMIAVELYEAPKVFRLFLGFWKAVKTRRQAVQRFLTGRLNKGDTLTFSQAWLEYRYGWRQLYFSAQALHKGLKLLEHPAKRIPITSHAYASIAGDIVSYSLPELRNYCTYKGLISTDYNVNTLADHTVRTEVRAATTMVVDRLKKAIDMNPFSFFWEITPYSFVVDWFLTTGDFFAALWPTFPGGPSDQTNCYSLKTIAELYFQGDSDPPLTYQYPGGSYNTVITAGGPAYAKYESQEYHRVPVLTGDIPLTLQWNVNLGWEKILDLLTLARSSKTTRRAVGGAG